MENAEILRILWAKFQTVKKFYEPSMQIHDITSGKWQNTFWAIQIYMEFTFCLISSRIHLLICLLNLAFKYKWKIHYANSSSDIIKVGINEEYFTTSFLADAFTK
jgi:hypothetical protein